MASLARPSSDSNRVMPGTNIRGWRKLSNSIPSQSPPPVPLQSPLPGSRITPTVFFVIVILAVVFFIAGLLHLLVRFLVKKRSGVLSSSENNERGNMSDSEAIQRQLQQLFHLHDSGLDQAFIDALPIFLYRELVGAKEPFDCAVCLCEFAEDDKLRLLPVCSHAFHLDCIDTWLLSNSSCPLCRGTLFIPGLAIQNPIYDFDDSREEGGAHGDLDDGGEAEKMLFSVRLGKFRSTQGAGKGEELHSSGRSIAANQLRGEEGESSSSLDRRCYSMGSFQYVVGESVLQVALSTVGRKRGNRMPAAGGGSIEEGMEGRRLCVGGRGESFSVSKIWQWSNKRGKFPFLTDDAASLDGISSGFTWRGRN